MIDHCLNLINEFLKASKYNDIFLETDFVSNNSEDENIVEAQKDKIVIYKGYTFSTSFSISINASTDELYSIAFYSKEVNPENHLIITEYLTEMMCLFVDFVSKELFLTIHENEIIIEFFRLYLDERELGDYPLDNGMTSISQGHFVLSHQFYNRKNHVYLNGVVHRGYTIWLQIDFLVEYINKNINNN